MDNRTERYTRAWQNHRIRVPFNLISFLRYFTFRQATFPPSSSFSFFFFFYHFFLAQTTRYPLSFFSFLPFLRVILASNSNICANVRECTMYPSKRVQWSFYPRRRVNIVPFFRSIDRFARKNALRFFFYAFSLRFSVSLLKEKTSHVPCMLVDPSFFRPILYAIRLYFFSFSFKCNAAIISNLNCGTLFRRVPRKRRVRKRERKKDNRYLP